MAVRDQPRRSATVSTERRVGCHHLMQDHSPVLQLDRRRAAGIPALGHHAIDTDHREISDQLHRIAACKPIQFPFYLARLKKLLVEHFDRESRLIERAGGVLCNCHRREHEALLELCNQARLLSNQSWHKAKLLLRNDMRKQFRNHVIYTDQFVVLLLNAGEQSDIQTSDCGD